MKFTNSMHYKTYSSKFQFNQLKEVISKKNYSIALNFCSINATITKYSLRVNSNFT